MKKGIVIFSLGTLCLLLFFMAEVLKLQPLLKGMLYGLSIIFYATAAIFWGRAKRLERVKREEENKGPKDIER